MNPVPMVGRADELREIVGQWARVVSGDLSGPGMVVLTGHPGVGKSRLVAAAVETLDPRPATVLAGTARLHSPAPYDWLAAVLSGRDMRTLPVPADGLAWLAQESQAPIERYAPDALLRLAVRTVRALVGDGPAVLVVEDLHALDPASLSLLAELAAAPRLPVLLIVTSQPAEAAVARHLVARTLARLSGVPNAIRQHLGPLAPEFVTEILTAAHPGLADADRLGERVWQRTGGNPYLLSELLAITAGRGVEALESLPADAGPEEAVELTARELQVLECLAAGMSNKQVAKSLDISIRTVAVHVSNLLRKTGSSSRTEAALWAVKRP
ncbi:LuxR family transcriptional regulator [Hamadaea sp.]|uniref:helix-turn-helix domain-containing protein n=1 Tax=Hamadaea sp. TaxID=2024425 RepID=UPI0025B9E372|nr:LuxR family transcriptional regulator [Hamadaea sp.]